MDFTAIKKYQPYIILSFLLIVMAIALMLRMIPAFFIKDQGFLYIYDTDSWYTLRQVEVMVKDFPLYNWFDPMTAYPEGKMIDWGPLYPFIAAILCLITRATTRSGIIFTAGLVSPLMAVMMVPVMYKLGKIVWDWKAGIIAAGLISVVSIQFFTISSYGWVDHHSAEVLFSTLFFLSYVCTISYVKSHPIDWRYRKTLIFPVFLSVLTGVIYFFGLLSSTTVVLALVVIAVYTLIQNMLDYFSDNNSLYLLVLNLGLLSISTILLFLYGFKQPGVSLIQYSIGLVYVNLAIITETVLLYAVSTIFRGKKLLYLISFAVLSGVGFFLSRSYPVLQTVIDQSLGLLLGFSAYSVAVVETLPWTLSGAWENFNVALILMAGGLLLLGYSVVKRRDNQSVFLLVWSVVMLLLTIRFQRFMYYFTVNVVILAAICIAEPIGWRENKIIHSITITVSRFFSSPGSPDTTGRDLSKKNIPSTIHGSKKTIKRSVPAQKNNYTSLKDSTVILIIILTVGLLAVSVYQDIQYGLSTPQHEISPDWVESLEWLQANTPQTGIDYFQHYDAAGFSFPPESYGIMAVWDAGHWITFIAHRIPITNPFQNNLDGPNGAAAFFLSGNESEADAILQKFGGRYVITDAKMAVDTFTNLVPWQSSSVDISPYIKWFLVPDEQDASRLTKVHLYDDAYFQTMVVRLHNFDGSMTLPATAEYVQYGIRQVPAPGETAGDVRGYARVIIRKNPLDVSRVDNDTPIIKEGAELRPARYASVFSDMPDRPTQKIPALNHYRLIHESPDNASVVVFPESEPVTLPAIKYIKIFEYVKGSHIKGEGIIELPVVTNTGRRFVYRQESVNGEFVVPYSTLGNPYDVRTTGPYHIAGTTRYVTVTENDVAEGK